MTERELLALMAAVLYTDVNTLGPKHAAQLSVSIIAAVEKAIHVPINEPETPQDERK